jgi:hypothetical protein
LADLSEGELGGGVFVAIGKDGDDDVAGAPGLGEGGEAFSGGLGCLANGIEEAGAATRDEGPGGEFGEVRDGGGLVGDEGEVGVAGGVLLRFGGGF